MIAKRIVIATWGSLGDLHPYLAIAIELRARGHQVLVASNALHRERIEKLGFEFAPLGPGLPEGRAGRAIIEQATHPWNGPRWLLQSFLDPYARRAFEEIDAACEGADFLLAHMVALSAPLVAQRRSLPWAAGVLSPLALLSSHDAPLPPSPLDAIRTAIRATSHGAPHAATRQPSALWKRIARPLALSATRPWFRHTDALSAEMGCEARSHPLFERMFSSTTLALFTRELGAPQPDWPRPILQCGVPILEQQVLAGPDSRSDSPSDSPSDWSSWIEEGSAPIVWTLGSTVVHVAHDFWRHAFHAARQMFLSHGLRSLFLVGEAEYWRMPTPARRWGLVAAYAPFEALFPRARIVVHAGGVGTTQAAMRAGAAHLIVPWAQDQPDNAARIVARGLGLSLHRARFNSEAATHTLGELADRPKYLQRAQAVAASMQQNEPNPAARAADAIEAMLPASDPG